MPVLLEEAIRYLNVRPGRRVRGRDAGSAGHASGNRTRSGQQGRLIAFDRDPAAMAIARAKLEALRGELGAAMPEMVLHDVEFSRAARANRAGSVDGLLADFGVSSMQLDEAHRGFSFQAEGPLDMRMDPRERSDRRTSGKPGRRKRTRRPDLRIRRGKEVAENRQSHCQGAADYDDGSNWPGVVAAAAPAMKPSGAAHDSSGDQDFSGSSNLCEWRDGRD